jgi:hypothetical protein
MNLNHATATKGYYLSKKETQINYNGADYTIYDILITPQEVSMEEFRKEYASNLDNDKALYRFMEDRALELRLWALNLTNNQFELIPFQYDEHIMN